jgi:hypothetical protein
MTMANATKGVAVAAFYFAVVGLAFPFLLEHFSPQITTYVPLPPARSVWTAFLSIGAAFAVTGFLQGAYSKGEYPWLAGKLGSAIPDIALLTYLYSLVPSSVGSVGTVETSQLLYLVYLAIALSYCYLVFDFFDARRSSAEVKMVELG